MGKSHERLPTTEPIPEDGEVSAMDFSPKDITDGVQQRNIKLGICGIQVPLPMLLITILSCIIVVIVAPSSYTFVTNAHKTIEQDANVLLNITMSKTFADVKNLMQKYETAAKEWANRQSTVKLLTTVSDFKTVTPLLSQFRMDGTYFTDMIPEISTIACHSLEGVLPGTVRQNPTMPNVTTLGIGWEPSYPIPYNASLGLFGKLYKYQYTDWSTDYNYTIGYGVNRAVFTFSHFEQPFKNYSNDMVYMSMLDPARKPGDGQWRVTYIPSVKVAFWNFASMVFQNPINPSKPSHICTAGAVADTLINPFLNANKPSDNGVIIFFNALNGRMLASSEPDSVKDIANAKLYNVSYSPSDKINHISSYLQGLVPLHADSGLPNWSSLGLSFHKAKLGDSKTWYIATRMIVPDAYNTFAFIVAFPREDFFHAIDKSITSSVILIACLSVGGLIGIAIASIVFILPLRILGKRMEEVTQMKFSSLEKGSLDRRSFVKEIATLETTFATMVKSFAAGIRKNADLVSGHKRGGTTTSTTPATTRTRNDSLVPLSSTPMSPPN
ncbi:hypothetical protein DFJ77DRAFT_188961 [Powellomyces hirtus]|nr:hypothetical protein DFJ77DRAFT_188961 [Powellomyces hirtus]